MKAVGKKKTELCGKVPKGKVAGHMTWIEQEKRADWIARREVLVRTLQKIQAEQRVRAVKQSLQPQRQRLINCCTSYS